MGVFHLLWVHVHTCVCVCVCVCVSVIVFFYGVLPRESLTGKKQMWGNYPNIFDKYNIQRSLVVTHGSSVSLFVVLIVITVLLDIKLTPYPHCSPITTSFHQCNSPYSPNISSVSRLRSTILETTFTPTQITSIPNVASNRKFNRYLLKQKRAVRLV